MQKPTASDIAMMCKFSGMEGDAMLLPVDVKILEAMKGLIVNQIPHEEGATVAVPYSLSEVG